MIKIVCMLLMEWLWCLSDLVMKPRQLPFDKIYKAEVAKKHFDEKLYKSLEKQKFNIISDYGYAISCELIHPLSQNVNGSEQKIAIISHGMGCSKCGSLKYAQTFIKLGFHVLVYDHRNHGLSGKALTSMGFYEKYDLKKVVDWSVEHYGTDCRIITHGESMGAATVLLHLGIDNRVTGAIADCAYSDLKQLLRHQLQQYYHLPRCVIPMGSCLAYLRAGFWYNEVSPIRVVSQTETPILFIHGKKDCFVPTYMSKQMYACKKNKKAIYLVSGARHAESCCINRKRYEEVVKNFIKSIIVKS